MASGFGMDGLTPTPCSDRAINIAVALTELNIATATLTAAKRDVPDYTGQWDDQDYYANELEEFYRAADRYEAAVSGK